MNRHGQKRLIALVLLPGLLLMLGGCFIQPDTTLEDPLTDEVNTLPFENMQPLSSPTATPEPSPTATATPISVSGWENWTDNGGVSVPTRTPTVTSYFDASAATPTPVSTYAPEITVRPTVAPEPTDDGTLRYGSTGTAVSALQSALKTLGYYSGTVDGQFGSGTKAALIAFQQANGLTADGVAGSQTLGRLYSDKAVAYKPVATVPPVAKETPVPGPSKYKYLEIGSTGTDVRTLQNRLKQLGYFTGTVNGVYGSDTAAAVMAFQQDNKLWVDGVAGPETQAMMYTGSVATPSTTASAYRTLKSGLSGSDVENLQNRLISLGYLAGTASGYYDGKTGEAVKAFQERNGLTVDGIAGSGTQTALYASTAVAASGLPSSSTSVTLREGSTGEAVYRLQERLYDLGYYTGRIDGAFGAELKNAVMAFQTRNGLAADGVVGSGTLAAVYAVNAVPAQSVPASNGGSSTSLKEGMISDDVMVMQQYLTALGYYSGAADGIFSAQTKAAVVAFQQRNGLTADGIAGSATLTLLYSGSAKPSSDYAAATLKQGDQGVLVVALQQRLADLGYLSGIADGKYGTSTYNAVMAFQKNHGLTADGVAGSGTQSRLFSDSALPYNASTGGVSLTALNNSAAELKEQELTGALQTNLAGGGIAALAEGVLYYADGGTGGLLYSYNQRLGVSQQVNNDSVRFLHATGNILHYVNGNDIIRYNTATGQRDVLTSDGYITKFTVYGGWFYYLQGGQLMRFQTGDNVAVAAANLNDYVIDPQTGTLYMATNDGIYRMNLSGGDVTTVISSPAQQVLLCDGVVYYRQNGSICRINSGIGALVSAAKASWFGIYRDKLYYISGSSLYVCDTNGQNMALFDAGPVATVSFVSGVVYIGSTSGGGYNRKLNVP